MLQGSHILRLKNIHRVLHAFSDVALFGSHALYSSCFALWGITIACLSLESFTGRMSSN